MRPLFYAMLLFDRAAPRGSRLLPVGPNSPTAAVKTWATVDQQGVRRIVVINKDPGNARSILLKAPLARPDATVQRLLAPTLHSTHYVTLAGQGYGDITKDGLLRGKKKTEPLKAQANGFKLRMPPGSAALVTRQARAGAPGGHHGQVGPPGGRRARRAGPSSPAGPARHSVLPVSL